VLVRAEAQGAVGDAAQAEALGDEAASLLRAAGAH